MTSLSAAGRDARSLSRRFKACFYLSAINLCALALPTVQAPYNLVAAIAGIVVNIAACWLILRNVEPSRDAEMHVKLAAFGIRSMWCQGLLGGVLLLTLALTRGLGKQALPCIIFGFGYFGVAANVLGMSTDKWIDELEKRYAPKSDR
jgi:hypothetical protein